MKYLTLGYGSSWGFSSSTPAPHPRVSELRKDGSQAETGQNINPPVGVSEATSEGGASRYGRRSKPVDGTLRRFIIGLRDDPENEESDDEDMEGSESGRDRGDAGSSNNRTMLRTLYVRMATSAHGEDVEGKGNFETLSMHRANKKRTDHTAGIPPANECKTMQVVVYVVRWLM